MSNSKGVAVIKIKGVKKRFGKVVALDDISLTVQKGHIHGFLGPNGAGKTTAIKILMDFIRPTSGKVSIFGMDARADSVKVKERVGYLSGDMELYDNLTGHQYLTYVAHLRGDGDYKHLAKLIRDLEVILDRKIGTLSRGNKQKIGLMAALMTDPDLLILDEPTTGLDPLMQQKFYAVVRDYARRGKTVFMSSHILGEVQEVCDVITFMKKGKTVTTVDVKDLLSATKRHIVMKIDHHETALEPSSQIEATNIKRTKSTLSFDVPSADRKVLRWIATQPVSDVTITEANLDSIFMDMYEEEESNV